MKLGFENKFYSVTREAFKQYLVYKKPNNMLQLLGSWYCICALFILETFLLLPFQLLASIKLETI